jgi:DNA-binding transcriptional LysR family regulator
LDRLETQLNNKIFERHQGELTLSAEGRRVVAIAERAEQELSQIQLDTSERRIKYGKVRISVSEHVLAAFAPELCTLIADLPDAFLEFTTSNRHVDLQKYEADIVLRIGRAAPSQLHSIELGPMQFACFRPVSEEGPIDKYWTLPGEVNVHKILRKENPNASVVAAIDGVLPMREAVLAGGGAALLPCVIGDKDDRLKRCSEVLSDSGFRLYVACLPEQRHLHRIRLVMKHLSQTLSNALC